MRQESPVRNTPRPVALVTGASSGIGREFCRQLAQRQYDLIVVARAAERLEALGRELSDQHGITVESLPADLSRDEGIALVAARIRQEPRLALLVNNAGFGTKGRLASIPPGPQEAMLHLHVVACGLLAQAALPGMVSRGRGGIINVSSVASFVFSPGNVNYCATKAYLTVLSEGLATELEGTGVRVQALCPGFTHTEFHDRMHHDKSTIPAWMWLSAERVVRTSLETLERGGPVVCVPGLRYKLLVALIRLLPRTLLARAAAVHRKV
ncbi:MAG: SDR family NAD(P)-dependent oxidoreductase [Gemmatimonadota bacterium]